MGGDNVYIPCVVCNAPYTLQQLGTHLFVQTFVCRNCYLRGLHAPAEDWCFGKPSQYDSTRVECSQQCPDRDICRKVVTGKLNLYDQEDG